MTLLKNNPVFLLLFPVFFVLHGFTENYDLIPARDAVFLALIYTGSTLVIAFLCWIFYRNITKASLAAFLFMGYQFFFGSIQDLLRKYFAGTFISRYSFILPVSLLFFLLLFIWLKRRKTPFQKLVFFLNLLLVVLVTIDSGWLISQVVKYRGNSSPGITDSGLVKCDSCKKPDIFFIILDAYSGNTALKEKFNFDNTFFENELKQRGFHIINNSSSNYNYTPFSIASILNMNYLNLDMKTKGPGNLPYCYRMIRNNRTLNFLQAHDYKFHNYSIFDFSGQPALHSDNFLPLRAKLITSQTFLSRIWTDILFNIATGKFNLGSVEKKIVYSHLQNNKKFTALTLNTAAKKTHSQKFIYTHLMMPHYPYYFDNNGRSLPFDSLVEGKQFNKHSYVEYLQYCNKKILELTDGILNTSSSPPIIILLGDHGFRYFEKKEDRKYCFLNLAAVYLPDRNYSNFNDTLSGVNLFPVIFNTQFQQHITIRKDSTIYLWE